MKEDAKFVLSQWKNILREFLDPLDMITQLPDVFPIGSEQYTEVFSKRKHTHDAVGIVIDTSSKSDILFEQFTGAIRQSGHGWLAALVSGEIENEEVEEACLLKENLEYIRNYLGAISLHIKDTIHADQVALELRKYITDDERQRIESRSREEGNRDAITLLLSILIRKPLECWKELTRVCKELNYDTELIDSLEALSINEPLQYASSDVESVNDTFDEDGFQEDRAKPIQNTNQQMNSRMAAQFPVVNTRLQSASPEQPGRQLREYQKDLSCRAINGRNVIICAPTGSGKTRVASHIIFSRFNHELIHHPKIAFIVPRVSLAKQQCDNIKTYFLSSGWSIDYLVGDSKATLKDSLRTANVIVMTAQILLNSLKDGSVNSLTTFNMILFDECHHTTKDNPYNNIMLKYLELKQAGNRALPQIVGLTATLGVGRGKCDSSAMDHMIMLCANLDATGGIVTVPLEHREELNRFTPKVSEDSVVLDDGTIDDPFTLCLCETIDEMVRMLYKLDFHKIKGVSQPQPLSKGSQQYIQWCQDFAAKANQYLVEDCDIRICRDVQACIAQIKLFNIALDLHFKCRAIDSLKFLEANISRPYDVNLTNIEDSLHKLAKKSIDKLKAYYNDPHCANKNLKKMEEEILDTFKKDSNSRAMLNVLKRQYAEPIRDWLNDTEALQLLNIRAEHFTGVGKSRDGSTSGLTHSKQEKILDMFRSGEIKILVCTPEVASEGMDIVDCNLVICYDYVKNEISSTQVKGRARKPQGRMVQFSSQSVMAKDKVNISKFLLMEKTTENIQNIFKNDEKKYLIEIQKQQNLAILTSRLKKSSLLTDKTEGTKSAVVFKVLCRKCSQFACTSEEIEVVNGTNHTCIAQNFTEKYNKRPVEDGGTEQKYGMFCKNCDSKWGIFARVKRILIPQLRPDAFKFINDNSVNSETLMGSKWKSIKITFKTVNYDDFAERMFGVNL